MSEPATEASRPGIAAVSTLRIAAATVSFLAVLALVVTVLMPAAGRAVSNPPLRAGLSILALCTVGMAVGILGSRGMRSPRRSVRLAWRAAALAGLATTCLAALPTLVTLGAPGGALAVVLWACAGAASFWVAGRVRMAGTTVARTWALASPWLALAGWGVLAAIPASLDVAVSVLSPAVIVVAAGAVGVVPGLLVRESVGSLRHEGLAGRLLGGHRAVYGVWTVLAVKAMTTLATVAVVVWRWRVVPDLRSWVSACGAVLILVLVLALDHRVPVFRRQDSTVASTLGMLVSLPLVVVVAGALALLTVETTAATPGPTAALLLVVVAGVALARGRRRLRPGWVLLAASLVGAVSGAAAMGSLSLPRGPVLDLSGPFLDGGVAMVLGLFAAGLLAALAVAAARRQWQLPTLVAALTLWMLWAGLAGGPQHEQTTNVVLSLVLPVLLVLHARGRQNLVDAGEILRFGLASVVLVDLPSLLVVLPDVVAPWALALGLAGPGVAVLVAAVRGAIRLRSVAFVGAVFGPLLAARLMAPFLTTGDLAEALEGFAGLLMGVFGLPLAALISAASAQPDGRRATTDATPAS